MALSSLPTFGLLGLLVLCSSAFLFYTVDAAKMPGPALKLFIFTPECFTMYFEDFSFFDLECLKTTASKAINLGIIAGAFVFKLPQVLKIVRARNVVGLSPSSMYMDVASFLPVTLFNIMNGNDIVTYGELIVILIQNVLIVLLFWYYSSVEERPGIGQMIFLPLLACGMVVGMLNLPGEWWWILPSVSSVFNIMSRIPQIATNFTNKHTGQLSVVTWFLQLAGSLGRMFTSLQEKGISDSSRPYIVGGQVVAVTLNVLVLTQIIFYWKETKEQTNKSGKNE